MQHLVMLQANYGRQVHLVFAADVFTRKVYFNKYLLKYPSKLYGKYSPTFRGINELYNKTDGVSVPWTYSLSFTYP